MYRAVMRTIAIRRQGTCLTQILIAFALIGALIFIVGIVSMATSEAGKGIADLQTQIKALTDRATVFEAPASIELELEKGGGMVAFSPSGIVGDKRIGPPPAGINYTVTITASDGTALPFQRNNGARNPGAPFEMLGMFETSAKGRYRFDVRADDGSATPVAIMVAAASKDEAKTILKSIGGGCASVCGLLMFVGFGIPWIVVSMAAKRARREQAERLEETLSNSQQL
jgi:hypothetical protein